MDILASMYNVFRNEKTYRYCVIEDNRYVHSTYRFVQENRNEDNNLHQILGQECVFCVDIDCVVGKDVSTLFLDDYNMDIDHSVQIICKRLKIDVKSITIVNRSR